jgi:hypothetical protein
MPSRRAEVPAENPFRAQQIRPGRIPFLLPVGDTWTQVLQRFADAGRRAEVIGPHGSGKSSFVREFTRMLDERGDHCRIWKAADQRYRVPAIAGLLIRLRPATILVLDGFDRLTVFARWFVRLWTKFRSCGLIVTAHAGTGLPLLLATNVTAREARHALQHLLPEFETAWGKQLDVETLLRDHDGNLREVLFHLFDTWQDQRPRIP